MSLIIEVSSTSTRETKRFVLKDGKSVEIGRANDDLHLGSDPRLSRRHFTINYSDGEISIKHLSKTNPTLVATDGTKEFKKVERTRTETANCRIIAGSHRFVVMVEKPESVSEQTLSEEGPSDFWSDVDGTQDESSVDQVSEATTPVSRTVRDHQSPLKTKSPMSKTDIFDDDDIPLRKSNPREPTKKPPAKVNKPFFPVTDDFFDD